MRDRGRMQLSIDARAQSGRRMQTALSSPTWLFPGCKWFVYVRSLQPRAPGDEEMRAYKLDRCLIRFRRPVT